jgi:hypothetical protein
MSAPADPGGAVCASSSRVPRRRRTETCSPHGFATAASHDGNAECARLFEILVLAYISDIVWLDGPVESHCMKIPHLHVLCMAGLAAACSVSHDDTARKTVAIGGKTLTLQAPGKCAQTRRPPRQLAKYLSQYDPADDPREDVNDETPWTKQEIQQIKKMLDEDGFHYPNGDASTITWLDFDDDGVCDFTASASLGFKLAQAHHTYMAGTSIVVPYIPVATPEEKLPVLVTPDTLLQWQAGRKQFATCETIQSSPDTSQQPAPAALKALCAHAREIYDWAASQLPHKNEIPD